MPPPILLHRNKLGLSPFDFILNENLKLAKQYLQLGDYQIQEVCFLSGFNNATHFIRAFKNEFGITPKVFQKKRK
ncbi:helix-turn-helix transcriptional regulator [Aquiflexum sp.]|uniref:helix-turn-helix transcriptional regulator n=1 Tax=Aquiflexum sp. TaxID=1872584 RepID=UPI0035933A4D